MKIDISKTFFSPRISNDRLDIAKQVKRGEKLLVMFSGIAPYGLVIAKNSKVKAVYCVELNRLASKYAKENIKLNKLTNTFAVQGDVKRIVPQLVKKQGKFDRIVMARPKLKDTFLNVALKAAKKGGIIHFHDFLKNDEIPHVSLKRIEKEVKKAKRKYKFLRYKKAGEIAPYKFRIRFDFVVI